MTMPFPAVVLITGASSGIGRATALQLADRGTTLVLASRSASALETVASECRARGAEVLVRPTDVSDEASVKAVVTSTISAYGRLDACVHAAAVVAYGRFEDVPSEIFDQVIKTGVLGTAHVARATLEVFREQQRGTLVILGSVLGRIAVPYLSSYATSKSAVETLARTLAIEQRDLPDVHVCVVSPGSVRTPVFRQAANYAGRYGRPPPPIVGPEKVARVIVGLLAKPRPRTNVGITNRFMVAGFLVLPSVFDAIVSPLMRVAGLSRDRDAPHPGNVLAPTPADEAVRPGEPFGHEGRVADAGVRSKA